MQSPRLSILVTLALCACSAPEGPALTDHDASTARVPAGAGAVMSCDDYAWGTLLATTGGAVFAANLGYAVRIQRLQGVGCELEPVGAPLIAAQLLDVDELGNVYVFPAAPTEPGDVTTVPASEGEFFSTVVARVDRNDVATTIIGPNRGVWSFGVSPAGDAMWVTACGPTGVFAMDAFMPDAAPHEREPLIADPPTLWAQMPSVLSDARTFWSVGTNTCAYDAALSDECGLGLVRATPSDLAEVGATVADFGAGFEQAALARCGPNVCAVYPSAVVVHDVTGAAIFVVSAGSVGAEWDERIGAVSGNERGLYVRLDGARGDRRLAFVGFE